MADSPFRSKRGLFKIRPDSSQHGQLDLSITLRPSELQRMMDDSQHLNSSGLLTNSWHGAMQTDAMSERSMLESCGNTEHLQQNNIFKEKADMLFPQFLEILQSRTNDSEVFDTIQEVVHLCVGIFEDAQKDLQRFVGSSGIDNVRRSSNAAQWLQQEIKTWKLLHALYKDRIMVQGDGGDMECDVPPLGGSEKEVIAQLYACNSTLREYQLVVDWLEAVYERNDDGPQVGHSTDRSVGWENSLFQLQNKKTVVFGAGVEIVKNLDPDAPMREKRPLHALDEEDNMRLSKCIFAEIRQGHIDEAMSLCKYCGQTWRAAILEGWRLHEDPNFDHNQKTREKIPIEGNPRRDIWKKCAWMMADSKKFDEYTRAIAGAFCGHLESLKSLLNNSWEDLLWAYLKVQIDIRVESEIRACCMKSYYQMPEAYWNSKMSLEQIFDELLVHSDAAVRNYASSKIGIIQKYLILDNVSELLQQIRRWIDDAANGETQKSDLSAHTLRFFAHIVLFMRQIGRVDKEETADRIISAYVESLIEMGDAHLVAFYTAALPGKLQISLYSKFLEGIQETPQRTNALEEALNTGLDVETITRTTVENMHERAPEKSERNEQLQVGAIGKHDQIKIRALEWLTFIPSQRGDLLWQANALMRHFLGEGKMECVRAAFEMVPNDSLTQILNIYGTKDNFPCREECCVKEYISYKVYLAALDNFNDWTRIYHNRPKEPQLVSAGANFTERIASEHKEQAYRAELNRWNVSLEEQTKVTRIALYNILVFPDKGWLVDPDTPKEAVAINETVWENRQIQLEKIRSICIPEITLLLHKVMHLTGDYQGCVKLADDIAAESRQLYKIYTKHKMAELMSKIAESSLELLNKKLDPWGYPVTI